MTQPIKCVCGALFGIEQDDGSLAIKYRDLFRTVRGSVSGPCRKCGADVNWSQPATWVPNTSSNSWMCNCMCVLCMSGSCCMNRQWHARWTLGNTSQIETTDDGQ